MPVAEHQMLVTCAAAAAAIALVPALCWFRTSRVRPLRLERPWIFPAVYAVVADAIFPAPPPARTGRVFCLVALVSAAGSGWRRGRTMRTAVDTDTHALNQATSPGAMLLAMLLAVLLIAVRGGAQGAADGADAGLDAAAITAEAVAPAPGLFTAQRLHMVLRGRRMPVHGRTAWA